MNPQMRILIVDDDQRMANTLEDILALQGYEIVETGSGAEALKKIGESRFDCIITDVRMPEMNGVELLEAVKKIQPDLPVVFMTAYAADALIQQGLDSGAVGVLNKPLDITHLLGFLASMNKEQVVTVVDDDPEFCTTLADILEKRNYHVRKISNPHVETNQIVDESQVILLDMKLNSISGADVLKKIRDDHPDLPVLLVTGYRDEMTEAIQKAMEFNIYTCLYKPLVVPELLQTLAKIRNERAKGLFSAGRSRMLFRDD